jgi:hypothetical protein
MLKQQLFQPGERPRVSLARGSVVDLQEVGNVDVRQAFDIPHQQNLSVGVGQLSNNVRYTLAKLLLRHRLAGCATIGVK